MHDLIIDTSTATCSISLFDDQSLVASYHQFIGRGHAEVLIPEIKKIMTGSAPDRIFVNVGPGSFTGIRIGISAARALALAWNIDSYGYSTMQLMSAIGLKQANNQLMPYDVPGGRSAIDVVMSGGHGEFYVQSFDANRQPIGDIMSLPPTDCQIICTAPLRIGDKASVLGDNGLSQIIDITVPDTRLFKQLEPYESIEVKPLYVRPPDAKIATKKNIGALKNNTQDRK